MFYRKEIAMNGMWLKLCTLFTLQNVGHGETSIHIVIDVFNKLKLARVSKHI